MVGGRFEALNSLPLSGSPAPPGNTISRFCRRLHKPIPYRFPLTDERHCALPV